MEDKWKNKYVLNVVNSRLMSHLFRVDNTTKNWSCEAPLRNKTTTSNCLMYNHKLSNNSQVLIGDSCYSVMLLSYPNLKLNVMYKLRMMETLNESIGCVRLIMAVIKYKRTDNRRVKIIMWHV